MSVAAVGAHMPATLTLDDVAAMATADIYGHLYEMSPEGALSIMPPAGVAHAIIASKLLAWFVAHGWSPDQVLQNCGIRITSVEGTGGRVPDLTVWSTPPKPEAVWAVPDALLLAIEIVSAGSDVTDRVVKKKEYAEVGIPRYWLIDRDAGNRVTMWTLTHGTYRPALSAPQPLSWLLNTPVDQHMSYA